MFADRLIELKTIEDNKLAEKKIDLAANIQLRNQAEIQKPTLISHKLKNRL